MTDGTWCTNTWATSACRGCRSKSLLLRSLQEAPTGFSSAATVATCLVTLAAFLSLPRFSTALPGFLGRLALESLSQGLLQREPRLSQEKEEKAENWWGYL